MPVKKIKKIKFTGSSDDNRYLKIPDDEIISIHYKLVDSYEKYLKEFQVKKLWDDSITKKDLPSEYILKNLSLKELQLIFLYKYKNCFVHKDLISAFIRKKKPNATVGLDQQVRHLGSQGNWYILNKSGKVPDREEKVPSGYHYLVSIELPNPKVIRDALKRKGRLAAESFVDLKIVYSNKCATCGIEEGKNDTRMNVVVVLQQGHMNPRKELTLANTIPQCQYCNQTYKDYFQFNENGRVIAVNNPEILLKSPVDVQEEMIRVLVKEREARENTEGF